MTDRMVQLSEHTIPWSELCKLTPEQLVAEHRQAAQRWGGKNSPQSREDEMDLGYELLRRLDPEAWKRQVARDPRAYRPGGAEWLAYVLAQGENSRE